MQGLNFSQLRTNPFRVLGLPASAGQADIIAAARRLRIWETAAEIPPTEWDFPRLGALNRARSEIEQAVAQLSDPVARLPHRLMWFAAMPNRPGADGSNIGHIRHDAALTRIVELFIRDSGMKRVVPWNDSLAEFCASCTSKDYVAWIYSVEERGGFDKEVTGEELEYALRSVASMIAGPLANQARDALDRGNVSLAMARLGALDALGAPPEIVSRFKGEIFDRVEDLATSRCNQLCEYLRTSITWGKGGGYLMLRRHRDVCAKGEKRLKKEIEPLLKALERDQDNGTERLTRVGLPAARALRNLGNGFVRCGRLPYAKKILLRAKTFAGGSSFTKTLDDDLANVKRQSGFFRAGGGSSGSKWWLLFLFVPAISGMLQQLNKPDNPPVTPYPFPEVRQIEQTMRDIEKQHPGLLNELKRHSDSNSPEHPAGAGDPTLITDHGKPVGVYVPPSPTILGRSISIPVGQPPIGATGVQPTPGASAPVVPRTLPPTR